MMMIIQHKLKVKDRKLIPQVLPGLHKLKKPIKALDRLIIKFRILALTNNLRLINRTITTVTLLYLTNNRMFQNLSMSLSSLTTKVIHIRCETK